MSASQASSTNLSIKDAYIYRKAINESGIVGSYYDARKDAIVGNVQSTKPLITQSLYKPASCDLIKGDNPKCKDLLHLIGIDEELWLSLTYNIVPATGIASFVNSSVSMDQNTRILYYHYSYEEKAISNQKNSAVASIQKKLPDITATHMITAVKLGIEILIVLQLPPDDQSGLDRLLEKIKKDLRIKNIELTKDEKYLLQRIDSTKVFSNILDLAEMTILNDIFEKLNSIKPHRYNHRPLEYVLRPIKLFYSSYSTTKATYVPIKIQILEILKQYHSILWMRIKQLQSSINSEIKQLMETYLHPQLKEIQHQIEEAEKLRLLTIEQIRDLLLKIRKGILQQDATTEKTIYETVASFLNRLDFIMKNHRILIDKAELINEFRQKNIQYLNMGQFSIQNEDDIQTIFEKILEGSKENIFLCCTDDLREKNWLKWNNTIEELLNKQKENSSIALRYADLSYNSFHLPDMKLLFFQPKHVNTTSTETLVLSNQQTLGTVPPRKEQSRDIKESLDRSNSSKSVSRQNTSIRTEQLNHANRQLDVSRSLTPKAASLRTKQSTNIEESLNSSTDQINEAKALGNTSSSPSTLSLQNGYQIKNVLNDAEKSFNQPKSNISSTMKSTISSDVKSNFTEKQTSLIRSPPTPTSEIVSPIKKYRPDSEHLSNIDYTNILLLGESGVGKSTFINALVNYLQFNTFQQAHNEKPLAVIPVSFIMTIDDNFEEKIIKYGDFDSNEDHNNLGQSVTQYCKSYLFKINNKTILRIIDTPGMGDTRGIDQDDINIKNILSFINNLSHLNAICILLKPNESRLNIVLRSYFTRLINFLGENAQNNIIFCFTNTRTTFFTPGNTGPLLKQMINKLPNKDIPFKKANTFCFDSESFRYLIARKNEIDFDEYLKQEYEKSWITSVKESNRFLKFILNEMKPYYQSEWKSIEHAQFKINQIIRPLLETMRNISRNIILLKQNSSKDIIELQPIHISQSSYICYKCQRILERYSQFWILPDDLHSFSDKCQKCDCPQQEHIHVDYELNYELSQYEGTLSLTHMRSNAEQFEETMFNFGEFYGYIVDILKQNDPMFSALNRMIAEENQICLEKGSECLNTKLYEMLGGIKNEYEKRQKISISRQNPIDLPSIYEEIEKLNEVDEISKQMDVIKQTQETYMKQNEKQVL